MTRSFLITLFLSLFIASFAYARSDKILVTVAAPQIYPFSYLDEQNQVTGILANCLNNNTNPKYSYSVIILPWARALEEVKNNRINAIMPTNYTKQRAKFLAYPNEPMYEFLSDVLVTKSSDKFISFNHAKEQNKIIAKVRSKAFSGDINIQIKKSGINILNIKDTTTALKMLSQNKIDYFVGDPQIVKHIAEQENILNHFSFVKLSDEASLSFLAFSKPFAKSHNINQLMQGIKCTNLLIN